ncbi:hypothetical protein FPHYL_5328 [Fusarium phyllophilum]|uniref:Uncharacterized protein n=1 Tax=Fusarium phyllophilum TaxID=47803 RepID=A0A8H5NFC7_9HYPO|nr:hypothetical protein FPHYL_5328 [Fusarium phyllophilum]
MAQVPTSTIEMTLKDNNEPTNGYILVDVDSTTPNPQKKTPYSNYVHKDGRVLMCLYNYKKDDPTPKEQALRWTDIMAASCVQAISPSTRLPILDGITSIWRINIARDNTQTHKIIDMLRRIHKSTGGPFEITPAADDLFFALLESDHGRGVASLLIDYSWMFSFKTITSAIVFPVLSGPGLPSFYWRLEPVAERLPPELVSSPSKKQARKHRKAMSRASIDSST